MKSLLIFFALVSFNLMAEVNIVDFKSAESSYNQAAVPDFTPWIGVAISGRCFYKNPNEKRTASVLLPTYREEGLMVAPITADKHPANFFDDLSYSQILKRFPQINNLFRRVFFNEKEAILIKQEGDNHFEAQIRELEDYFFVKVILRERAVRYCYYNKR